LPVLPPPANDDDARSSGKKPKKHKKPKKDKKPKKPKPANWKQEDGAADVPSNADDDDDEHGGHGKGKGKGQNRPG
jgi:hypothetical protein